MPRGGLAISVLGRLAVERGGVVVDDFGGRRAELVFAYLAVEHRRSVTRDELADALWPESLPDTWAASLRGVVSDVRQALDAAGLDGAALLDRGQRGYRLNLPNGAIVDWDEAKAAVAGARALLTDDPPGAAASARAGADLAALPFLPEHEGTWVDDVRRQVGALFLSALDCEARAWKAAGDHRAAAQAAERLVRADPFTESAHRLRIEIHTAAGDRAGALRAYEECRRILADELGVAPSGETDAARARAVESGAVEPAPAVAAGASATRAGPYAGYSVLVVEDHDFQRRTAMAILRGLGVSDVREARDGGEALRQLEASGAPDVILCDIDMPGMDGVEFIRQVAAGRLTSGVAIVSALDRNVLAALEAVTVGHGLQLLGTVEKPVSSRRLADLLDRYRPDRPETPGAALDVAPAEVLHALEAGDVHIGFAPVVDLTEGRVAGAMVTAVWHGHGGESIGSDRFVPVLARAGHAAAFTDFLLARACDELVDFATGKRDVRLWLPLPDAEVDDPALADRLAAPVRDQGLDPGAIVWVVGVAPLRRRRTDQLGSLIRVRVKGFGLALDGLAGDEEPHPVLAHLPITAIRFDPRLVGAVARPSGAAALEQALSLARRLDVTAVVPGCVTAEDFDLLVSLGCPLAEGAPVESRVGRVGLATGAGGVAAMVDGWAWPAGTGRGP